MRIFHCLPRLSQDGHWRTELALWWQQVLLQWQWGSCNDKVVQDAVASDKLLLSID